MGLRINTNVPALEALRNLGSSDRAQRKSMERLSTGLRINSAADDPAGLVISEQLRAQVNSIKQATENSQNASNMIGSAEAALSEVSSLLNQVRESVVFALGSNSPEQIAAEQDAVDNALSSIDRIAQTTKFANKKLLDGSAAIQLTSTVGAGIEGVNIQNAQFDGLKSMALTVNVTQIASKAGGIGIGSRLLSAAVTSAGTALVLRVTGMKGTEDITVASRAVAASIVNAVNAFTANTGVYASGGAFYSVDFGSDQTISIEVVSGSLNLVGGTAITSTSGIKSDLGRDAVANVQGASVSAKGNELRILSSFLTGDIMLKENTAAGAVFKIKKTGLNFQLNTSDAISDQERIGIRNMATSVLGAKTRTIAGQNGTQITIGGFLSSIKSGGGNDLRTNPENSLRIVDRVIDQVTDARSYLGAFQRMTIDTNTSSLEVAGENLAASESTIRDLDFAAETSEFTRTQILFQAGTAVLGQANQIAQTVLTLLR